MSRAKSPLLQSLNLVVRDMDATLAFYRRLGLEIPDSAVWRTETGPHHVDLKLPGGLGLDFDSSALAERYNAGWRESEAGEGRCVIGFSVATREEVDERYAALTAAGYTGLQPPYDAFWGARYAIVRDPDGNPVGLMSPSDPARRGPPPAV
jgi:catechol 2,3-dioxygenase-like lactoylglutathione lyase family enzyme